MRVARWLGHRDTPARHSESAIAIPALMLVLMLTARPLPLEFIAQAKSAMTMAMVCGLCGVTKT